MSSSSSNIHIRTASPDDAAALLAIYAPYVRETAITFEYDVPSTEEFVRRITHTLEKYPYLVAEKDHSILGYAYAGPFHERAAYDWAVETSIYVDRNQKHSGIGRLLYDTLENVLKNQEKHLIYDIFADFGYFSSGFGKKCTFFSPIMQL